MQMPSPEDFAAWLNSGSLSDVDNYGVPIDAFGPTTPPEFFEILGRLLAVNGKIEYLKDRLAHLPEAETNGVGKVEQFTKRYESGRLERHSIVHSRWIFDAHSKDPEVIVGVRYKVSKAASGEIATVSITGVRGSEHDQVVVQYTLNELRKLLKRDVTTMLIGERAHTEVNMRWAAQEVMTTAEDLSAR
jgi:hypothetical protein